jgi:hypothetical protein
MGEDKGMLKMKTPLLDRLRAERERDEDEIKAPIVDRLNRLNNEYTSLWKEKNRIAKIASSDFGKAVLNEFVDAFSRMIYRKFLRALSNKDKDKMITMKFSKSILGSMTPESFERYCLMNYIQHIDETSDLSVSDLILDSKSQILSIHIPKLDIHKVVEIYRCS